MAKLDTVFATEHNHFAMFCTYFISLYFFEIAAGFILKNLDFRKNLVVVLYFFSVVKVSPASESIAGALRGRHEPNVARFGRG
mgnify:CR=1 FL=1